MSKDVQLIGASFGWGAGLHEVQAGPQSIRSILKEAPWHVIEASIPYTPGKTLNYAERLAQVVDFTQRLANEIIKASFSFPVVIGGDHSIAIGTWSAQALKHDAQSNFGLIWIDAHMDSHTPQTTPSENIHGMPLAALMGHGEASLVNLLKNGAKLSGQHIVLIGVRSFEIGEAKLLEQLKVKTYFIDEVLKRGFKTVFDEAVEYVSHNTKGFGVSLDIDAIDPTLAPGTGAPEPNGIVEVQALVNAFKALKANPKCKGIEIVEFDPTRDINNKTTNIVTTLISSLL